MIRQASIIPNNEQATFGKIWLLCKNSIGDGQWWLLLSTYSKAVRVEYEERGKIMYSTTSSKI